MVLSGENRPQWISVETQLHSHRKAYMENFNIDDYIDDRITIYSTDDPDSDISKSAKVINLGIICAFF